jgi:hypothetical protein
MAALSEQAGDIVQEIRRGLDRGDYVLIPEARAAQLLPLLQSYRHVLIAAIGHDDWARETAAEESAGMDSIEAKWGAGRGWRLYCVTDLIRACEASIAQHEVICVAFS